MADIEQKYIYPLPKDKSTLFLRYIDDIFMAGTKSEKQLKDFISDLNQKHCSIKFNYKFDSKQIEPNKLKTTLLRKPSDRQALRIRQICSTFPDYHDPSREIIEKFVNKG